MPNSLVVIGGSGDIGKSICLKAAALPGTAVCVHYYSNRLGAEEIVNQLRRQKVKAVAKHADVRNPESLKMLFNECEIELGPIQFLVNASAIQGKKSGFLDVSYKDLVDVIHTNFFGVFISCQQAIESMIKNDISDCSVVNISSQAALHGSPHEWIHYACSKASIDTLTKGLSKEFGEKKIRINAVRPGLINTKIHTSGGSPDRLINKLNEVALGRIGTTDEVAELVLFLLGKNSSYITGAIVDINGGRL